MNWHLIQAEALAALAVCLFVGVVGILTLMNYSFAHNPQALAVESASGAGKLFQILEAREISKMTVVSQIMHAIPQIYDALAAQDRTSSWI
ncbi:MAG: hypothetical protein WBQ89_00815 [Candidatus Acidiferrum sp.]